MDYMRVFNFNFHLKDFKDRVPDRNERKFLEKNNEIEKEKDLKKMKVEKDDAQIVLEESVADVTVTVTGEDSVEVDKEANEVKIAAYSD